jgi:hypothetical protein
MKGRTPDTDSSRLPELDTIDAPASAGADRRAFMMRSAMIGAVAVLEGFAPPSSEKVSARAATATSPLPPAQAKEMNSKYRETSEGGLAVFVVLC